MIFRVAYWLDLPSELSQIHNTFHVFRLRKCMLDDKAMVPLDDIQVDGCLKYIERLVYLVERNMKVMYNKEIPSVKV